MVEYFQSTNLNFLAFGYAMMYVFYAEQFVAKPIRSEQPVNAVLAQYLVMLIVNIHPEFVS